MTGAETIEWLGQLHSHRAHVRNKPDGHQLAEPQCREDCPNCNLACAMATFVIRDLERGLGHTEGRMN